MPPSSWGRKITCGFSWFDLFRDWTSSAVFTWLCHVTHVTHEGGKGTSAQSQYCALKEAGQARA
jgi:hypothetical protein